MHLDMRMHVCMYGTHSRTLSSRLRQVPTSKRVKFARILSLDSAKRTLEQQASLRTRHSFNGAPWLASTSRHSGHHSTWTQRPHRAARIRLRLEVHQAGTAALGKKSTGTRARHAAGTSGGLAGTGVTAGGTTTNRDVQRREGVNSTSPKSHTTARHPAKIRINVEQIISMSDLSGGGGGGSRRQVTVWALVVNSRVFFFSPYGRTHTSLLNSNKHRMFCFTFACCRTRTVFP
jgi:hypothetical protein